MSLIRVTSTYIGWRSNEQPILPGVYEVGDPRLFGLEDYLVESQGKAKYIKDEPGTTVAALTTDAVYTFDLATSTSVSSALPEDGETIVWNVPENTPDDPPEADDDTEPEAPDYESFTVEELREQAAARGIDLEAMPGTGKDGRLLKADLVFILQGADRDAQTFNFEGRLIHAEKPADA